MMSLERDPFVPKGIMPSNYMMIDPGLSESILEASSGTELDLPSDPFKLLVATMLSQNTSGLNQLRALSNLEQLGLNPWDLAKLSPSSIQQAIRPAGMQRIRALKLNQLAHQLISKYQGRLESILALPIEPARKLLLELPGVGPKTADILLLFWARKPVFPVDRHIARIAIRLGLVTGRAGYEQIRSKLESMFHPQEYLRAHLGLIRIGREYCRPRNPRCHACCLARYCSYGLKAKSHGELPA